ncbi:MAG: PTS transporter subunit EIIC [Treponema sp.]|nr:PTS transporter subunit EIIC [Treponema sp.]
MSTENLNKQSLYKTIIDQISGIFMPFISIITAASIIKSIMILLAQSGAVDTASGLYKIFFACGDGFFYFLPFFLCFSAAKQWNCNPYIALLIPVSMLYPDLLAILENNNQLSFLGLPVKSAIYHSSVIPVLLGVGLLHFVEKPCDRFLPEAIRSFLKPVCCMIIVLPVTFLVFGPIGTMIGNVLTKAFFWIYDKNAVLAGAFMGFFIQPMVVIGAHWPLVPVALNNISVNGYDVIMPLLGAAVYGQCGASLAIGLMYKNIEKKRNAFQSSFSCALGVTEPALYTINVPLVRPFIAACIAGSIGGAIIGWAGTHCISFTFPSFLTCVAFFGPGFGEFCIAMILGFILGFVLTILQKKFIILED